MDRVKFVRMIGFDPRRGFLGASNDHLSASIYFLRHVALSFKVLGGRATVPETRNPNDGPLCPDPYHDDRCFRGCVASGTRLLGFLRSAPLPSRLLRRSSRFGENEKKSDGSRGKRGQGKEERGTTSLAKPIGNPVTGSPTFWPIVSRARGLLSRYWRDFRKARYYKFAPVDRSIQTDPSAKIKTSSLVRETNSPLEFVLRRTDRMLLFCRLQVKSDERNVSA